MDAFTKVGSARPELLKNKAALVAVTKEAIILSNAAKIDLQPAIEGLTMVTNQYNVSADQARRIINVLGAGSKAGAGEIPYLTVGLEKAGTTASLAGLSIETLAATLDLNHHVEELKRYEKALTGTNEVLKVENLESTEEGVFLNETQLAEIENRLALDQQIMTERDTANAARDAAIAERDSANTNLMNAMDPFNAIDASIASAESPEAKVLAIRALLSKKPATQPAGIGVNQILFRMG